MAFDIHEHRLLILDDETEVGQTIALVAQCAGFEARPTTSADSFFQELRDWQPTHVAIDLMMPGMDGIEVLCRLAEAGCRARIIITSGIGSRVLDAARRSAVELGLEMAGVLPKPFTPAGLRTLLGGVGPCGTASLASSHPAAVEIAPEALRQALERGELEVFYQPKVECATGAVHGFEALVRWRHPAFGLVMPDRFIPVAEEHGLIDALTDHVVETALTRMTRSPVLRPMHIAVNLSPKSLTSLQFAERLRDIAARCGVEPCRVILEITESSLVGEAALEILTRLRIMGFQVSIDDFGSGYSSLLQLMRLPFSEIKVDKAFAMSALPSHESRAVLRTSVELGHSLGLRVVAEGVEDAETLAYLREIGCDLAQGYFFSRPMPADGLEQWIERFVSQRAAATAAGTTESAR